MAISVHNCERSDLRSFLETGEAAFAEHVDDADEARVNEIVEPHRMLLAKDGDLPVGASGAFRFELTVPGGELPAAGVTLVGVIPSHRRQGVLTALMRKELDDLRAWDEPLAVLWCSESSIYGRYGYGVATRQATIDIEGNRAQFRNDSGRQGKLVMLSSDEALKSLPPVYERVCAQTPGMYRRSAAWWKNHTLHDPPQRRDGDSPQWRVALELEGRTEAFAIYRIHAKWGSEGLPTGHARVIEVMGTSPVATREIWRFLFSLDLVARIQADAEPADTPLLTMLSEARRLRFLLQDGLWLRIVDIKKALEGRSYAVPGSLVLEVEDAFCSWNKGRWKLTSGQQGNVVERSDDRPDIMIDTADLASTYLGGVSFGEINRAGAATELTAGAMERADTMFRTERAPWCPEMF
ncbi:MAG: GNAT family N-acetyltransferase [Actinobacteria bacterium]|nr:GNAT family N-acetyltransferase [Actinomycetota bacterium]